MGKYTGLYDSYLSVANALKSAARACNYRLKIVWIDSEFLEPLRRKSNRSEYLESIKSLESVSGILIPGGFGVRGIEGKIYAAKYARENNVPFFGICLGMQVCLFQKYWIILKVFI